METDREFRSRVWNDTERSGYVRSEKDPLNTATKRTQYHIKDWRFLILWKTKTNDNIYSFLKRKGIFEHLLRYKSCASAVVRSWIAVPYHEGTNTLIVGVLSVATVVSESLAVQTDAESLASVQWCRFNLGEFWAKRKRIALLFFQRKGNTVASALKNYVSHPGRIWWGIS